MVASCGVARRVRAMCGTPGLSSGAWIWPGSPVVTIVVVLVMLVTTVDRELAGTDTLGRALRVDRLGRALVSRASSIVELVEPGSAGRAAGAFKLGVETDEIELDD